MLLKPIRTALITGGAGFIGSNLAARLAGDPDLRVRIFDNFSRAGAAYNLRWLQTLPHTTRLEVVKGDIRDRVALQAAVRDVTEVYHLAAQVAVTTSVSDPLSDFQVNALGTLNVLEAARFSGCRPFMLFTSTNKVYGALDSIPLLVEGSRYRSVDADFIGVKEDQPLDFHSPYGCSKGAADQYVRDYARIYGLPTVVFRMSCIAGPRQFGNEDQGWVAHFLYSALSGKPITVYGCGLQVRDILHVQDLLDAMILSRDHITRTSGEVFNVGGGLSRSVSLLEMLDKIGRLTQRSLTVEHCVVRPGDQPLYISDTSKLMEFTGWRPSRDLDEITRAIYHFWSAHRQQFREMSLDAPHLRPAEVA